MQAYKQYVGHYIDVHVTIKLVEYGCHLFSADPPFFNWCVTDGRIDDWADDLVVLTNGLHTLNLCYT